MMVTHCGNGSGIHNGRGGGSGGAGSSTGGDGHIWPCHACTCTLIEAPPGSPAARSFESDSQVPAIYVFTPT